MKNNEKKSDAHLGVLLFYWDFYRKEGFRIAADGSIVFDTTLDNTDLRKKLAQTKKDIDGLNEKIENEKGKQLPLIEQVDQLQSKIKKAKKEVALYKEQWKSGVPGADRQEMDASQRLTALTTELNSVYGKIEKHDTVIARYEASLEDQVRDAAELEKKLAGVADNTEKAGTATEKLKKEADKTAPSVKKTHQEANKISPAMEKAQNATAKFARRLKETLKSAFIFSVIYKALSTLKNWMGKVVQSNNQAAQALAKLKGALLTLVQPIVDFVIPILTTLVNIITTVVTVVASALSALFGTTLQKSKQSAKALNEQANAIDGVGDAADKAEKSMAGFDTINQLSGGSKSDKSSAETPTVNFDFDAGDAGKKAEAFASKVKQAIGGIVEYVKQNYQPAIQAWGTAFGRLKEPVQQAASSIQTSFGQLKQNTLQPLAEYTMGTFVPNIVNSFSTNVAPMFSDVLGFSVKEFAKDFEFMCQQVNNFVRDLIRPAMELFEKVFTDVFDSIGKKWSEVGEGLLEKLGIFRDTFKQIWNTLYDKIFKPVMDRLFKVLNWLWDDHLKPLWDRIVDFFASLADCIMTVWNNFLGPLVNWIASILGPIITGVINTIIDVVSTIVAVIADVLGGVFRALGGLLDFITGVFSGNWEKAWQGICDFFGGIWDIIWGVIKGVINLIIDGLNALWRAVYSVFAGIANAIGGAVEWIGSLFGQEWGFSMPSEPPTIPKLATGAVIPANREFLAVLGDQKHGRNLEAPEDLIRQIVREEAGRSAGGETVIRFDGTMGQLIRAMKPYLDEEERRRGVRLVNSTI